MKSSNRGSDFVLQACGFRRAAGLSFSDLHERSSPTGGSPARRKPPPFGPTCGAPGGARMQNKILRRLFHAVILSAAVFLFMGAGDDSARFKDLGHRMMCACGGGGI